MTTAPPSSTKRKHLRLVLWAVPLLVGVAVAGYFAWRPRPPVLPPIATDHLDAEVVAAIDTARAGVEARPESAAAWGRLGMVLFAQDMYADCIGILAEAERLDPNDARWPYYRGLALILNQPEEGIAALQRAAAIPPYDLTTRLRQAEETLKLGRLEEADELFRALLADHPDNPRALLGRGQILLRRGQCQDALLLLRMAALDPTARRSGRVALAEAHARLGNAADAEAERQRAAESPADLAWPDPFLADVYGLRTGLQPRIDRALQLLSEGKIDEAGTRISQVVRDHPDSDEAHLTLAKILMAANHLEEAEKNLRRAIQLNPNLVNGHYYLAAILMQRQDYAAAQRSYLRTIELKPSHGLAHHKLGECWLRLGNRAKALDAFRDALRCRPDLTDAHVELAALLLQEGKVEEATVHLENAVRLDGKNDRARGLLEQARAKKKPS